jgi:hypothetical protein
LTLPEQVLVRRRRQIFTLETEEKRVLELDLKHIRLARYWPLDIPVALSRRGVWVAIALMGLCMAGYIALAVCVSEWR